MAADTPDFFSNLVIYSVYVRNHSPGGNFAEVQADLARIQAMGVDVVWFLPIHPIGEIRRKGKLGSPYSIADYRAVNPEYGGEAGFHQLVDAVHQHGMKVMIDVVYNHTAHDSILVKEHPEYFHRDEHEQPITTVPEWSDVSDLKHPHPGLSEYLIENLCDWVRFGVDGFRCDVASLLPIDFWCKARQAVAEIKPGVIWLAESVHADFVRQRRYKQLSGCSDSELYSAFDMTYDYDIWPAWHAVVRGELPLTSYLQMLCFQDCIYPANYLKMRCTENHDQPRTLAAATSETSALAWMGFAAFNKGPFLIYAGQEAGAVHTPSLFDRDPIDWSGWRLQPFITRLARLKKDQAVQGGKFQILDNAPDEREKAIQAAWEYPGGSLYGIFNVNNQRGSLSVQLPDGIYPDLLNDRRVKVQEGRVDLLDPALILRFSQQVEIAPFTSPLLSYRLKAQ